MVAHPDIATNINDSNWTQTTRTMAGNAENNTRNPAHGEGDRMPAEWHVDLLVVDNWPLTMATSSSGASPEPGLIRA